jgi:hypothetical protein
MADDFKNRDVPRDRSCISMKQEHEVRYWTGTLGCSKGELAAALARVGNSSDAVRREVLRAWAYGTFRRGAPEPRNEDDAQASVNSNFGRGLVHPPPHT